MIDISYFFKDKKLSNDPECSAWLKECQKIINREVNMKHCVCDICGSEQDAGDLLDLRKWYQTDKVKEICGPCNEDINTQLSKIKTMLAKTEESVFKRYLKKLRKKRYPS